MHSSTENLMRWLTPNELLPGPQRKVAAECHDLAEEMVRSCPEGAELSSGLRKLLEAKDAFVRASLERAEG